MNGLTGAVPFDTSTSSLGYSTRRLTLAYAASTCLYALSGLAMLIVGFLMSNLTNGKAGAHSTTAAVKLSLQPVNLRGGIASGVIVSVAALLAMPGMMANATSFLKAASIINIISIVATLSFGLSVWFVTLVEKSAYLVYWRTLPSANTALLQDKFNCCGYLNSTTPQFVQSIACPNADLAFLKQGCHLPLTSFSDKILYVFPVLVKWYKQY